MYDQDHLGLYDVITTDNKTVSERHYSDPWGNQKTPLLVDHFRLRSMDSIEFMNARKNNVPDNLNIE